MIIGGVGELRLPGDRVADGIDAAVAGLELAVDENAGAVVAHAGGGEIEAVDRRLAPGGDQQMAAFDRFFARRAGERHRHAAAGIGDARHLHAGADDDAFALELRHHDGGAFRIVIGKRRRRFQHGHLAAEAAEALRHLQADRPGADDDEMARQRR